MKIVVYTLNAFAKTENGGNPSGVVLDAEFLSEFKMQDIAKKVGFSETAFIQKSDVSDYKIRFFTPKTEVDLCGHATIAAFSLLAQKGIIEIGEYTQETKAGILMVENHQDETIYMCQNRPTYYEEIDKQELADSLNINESIIMQNYPTQIVSTGLRDIIIPINTLNDLHEIKPNFTKIASVSKKYNVIGYHVFTLDTKYSSTAHCRNFAPLYEITEEAATGTSNGALSCYLFRYGIISKNTARYLVFEQGYSMKRPSEILTSLDIQNKEIIGVKVGGVARYISKMEIDL
ncbi:PhzF family phenazine biosynthesis protein [Desulfosporosinus sp.]|uniref:PhzF family phenazine biosynthesis protein n=1 Tax=Desulfosporosinus sp. TaxID=157907 RepID=UPI0025C4865B|nr:PhzF family phenazine biosynthesis protein [Desulfosporosinus sp.]MBC2725091.1 PhzF family phenazine biosynthesis protein [Desulfosporosinus sp.]